MSAGRSSRLREILAGAMERDTAEQPAYLDRACDGDGALRSEIESILATRRKMEGFLELPAARILATAPPVLAPGERVGSYEVVRVLGTGGSGTVYEAMQARPRRRVALKVMRADAATPRALRRFGDEAEILARLRHPGVAHVYEAGFHRGLPFLAIEFVEGARGVLRYATEEGMDRRARLRLMARVCDAVHHGHQKGVIHRDLKPGNVLVDAEGNAKVIDFGIARLLDESDAGSEVIGTPPYMSPEQCEPGGARVDVRTDVYALGVMTYELLSGVTPHEVDDVAPMEAIRRIANEPPAPLSSRDRSLSGDADAIVMRAIARRRGDRYASAAALADDLRRHLDHRPVEARGGGLYLLSRLARRHWLVFGSLAAVVVVSVASALVSLRLAAERERERRTATFQAYLANVAAADAAARTFDAGEARRRLLATPAGLRDWEWYHLAARVDRSVATLETVRGGPSLVALPGARRFLVSVNHPYFSRGTATILDLETGRETTPRIEVKGFMSRPALSPDGRLALWGTVHGVLAVSDASTLEEVRSTVLFENGVSVAAWLPDGERIVAGGEDGLRILSAADLRTLEVLMPTPDSPARLVTALAVDPAGRSLAVGELAGPVEIFDLGGGTKPRHLPDTDAVSCLAFHPREGSLLAGDHAGRVYLADPDSGELRILVEKGAVARSVAFREDGRVAASGHDDGRILLFDTAGGELLATVRGHGAGITSVGYPFGDGRLISGSRDGRVKVWRPGIPVGDFRVGRHPALIRDLAYDRTGERIATAAFDGIVRVFSSADAGEVASLFVWEGRVACLHFLPDGRLVVGASDGGLRVWDPDSSDPPVVVERFDEAVLDVAGSPDGRFVATGVEDGTLLVRELGRDGPPVLVERGAWTPRMAFSPDGARLATTDWDPDLGVSRVRVLDTADAFRERLSFVAHEDTVGSIAFSPDGSLLATGARDGDLRLWDPATGEGRGRLEGFSLCVERIAFHPDGRRIAAAAGRRIRLWDVASGQPVLDLRGHSSMVHGLAFHPDGTQLASAGGGYDGVDCTLRLWGRTPDLEWPPRLTAE